MFAQEGVHRHQVKQFVALAGLLASAICLNHAGEALAAVQNLSTVQTVYQSDWSGGVATGWSGTTAIRTADRKSNTIPSSLVVGDTTTNSAQTATYALSSASSAEGSFRLTFIVQFDNSGSFSTNWGDVYLYNSVTSDNWQIRIQQTSSDGSSGIVLRRNGQAFTNNTATFSWATGASASVGKQVKIIFERDADSNVMNVYATYNISADISTLTPLITTTNVNDIGGIDQIRITERDTGNKRLYSSITLATNPVPEAASLTVLGASGVLLVMRRRL